jgi:hypothetical protein
MNTNSIWPLAIPVFVAVIGIAAKFWNDLAIARRKDRLERVSQQLRQLYGPLYAQTEAANSVWLAFARKYRPEGGGFWREDLPPSSDEQAAWRLWMTEVFMPINLRLEQLVINNADLLIETEMPPCLLDLCAHVAAYKAVLKRWAREDFSEHTSVINFPRGPLRRYLEPAYRRLKAEQAELLGKLQVAEPSAA